MLEKFTNFICKGPSATKISFLDKISICLILQFFDVVAYVVFVLVFDVQFVDADYIITEFHSHFLFYSTR